eukprot:CAMPEP_0117445580 /NCGR_PEP_ID=MMETSP0759-20121206/5874_1 /TAXON_ID=63605 /ORGANISM="Percolomonas cosmopolitus, Strain WS" /LENGTH=889 /DNA_ID=CAMNT_0005237771 /DNA_START=158 /DNA_END=2827 /DNA_ORIENTATION=-
MSHPQFSHKKHLVFLAAIFLLLSSFPRTIFCADYYWKPSHSGKWSDLSNWVLGKLESDEKPKVLPETGDSIYITQSGSYEVIFDLTPKQSLVYERIIIGASTDEIAKMNPLKLRRTPSQMLTVHTPISVNSKIHINNNGVFRMDSEKVAISGGATLECEKGGKVEHFLGDITTIGDITIAGVYELHSGIIAGSGDHALVVTPEGHFKTLGPDKSSVKRPVQVSGLFEHAASSHVEFFKEIVIDDNAQWLNAASGHIRAADISLKGKLTVNAEMFLEAHLNVIGGKVIINKPFHVLDTLNMKENSHMSVRRTSLLCHKSCNIQGGNVEGHSQTQDNRIELRDECQFTIDDPGAILGNVVIHVNSGTQLVNWSGKNDFNGSIHVHGSVKWISGNFKLSGAIIVYQDGHLYTQPSDDESKEPSKKLSIQGEVQVHGKYTHTHTSDVVFNSAFTIEKEAQMLWAGSGEIQGEGTLQNSGVINVGSSSRLSIADVYNEGDLHVHSAKFTIGSEHFTQETQGAILSLNGARLVVDSHMKLYGGELRVSGQEQSFVVVAPKGHIEQNVKLHGQVSLSIHGEYTAKADVGISRNIDVFSGAQFTVKEGDVIGEGQLLIHKDGLMQIEQSAECTLQKVVIIAGKLHIEGNVMANSDITVLESTGLVHLTHSASIKGKGHLTNHGELRMETSAQSKVELTINNSGKTVMHANTHLTKPFQQIDSSAQTILDHATLRSDQEFVLGDGMFFGIGTVKTPRFSCAGNYGAYVGDEIGTLYVSGDFLSPGTATAHFKVRSAKEHSILEVDKELHVDGSVLKIELTEGFNPDSSSLELIRASKVKGEFARVELATDHETEVNYLRDEGKIVLKLKRGSSGGTSVGGQLHWLALILFVSVIALVV